MMALWLEWFRCVRQLRAACARKRSFLWMALVLAAVAMRSEILGVTSFVRASFLNPLCYDLLLHFFHSSALSLSLLLEAWGKLVMNLFRPVSEAGYVIFVADGLKVPKEGKKMPAVKCLHQESGNNSKPEFIMGHSFQAVSLLVHSTVGQVFAVPLVSRICEGLIWNRDPFVLGSGSGCRGTGDPRGGRLLRQSKGNRAAPCRWPPSSHQGQDQLRCLPTGAEEQKDETRTTEEVWPQGTFA
jgi:hypothetical protein